MSINEPRDEAGRQRPLEDLYLLGAGSPMYEDFGALASAWLSELPRAVPGSYGRKTAGEFDFPPRMEPEDYRRPVRLENGQVVEVWLNRYLDDPRRDGKTFRRAEVRAYSSRTDKAALAALSVLEGSGVGETGVRRIGRWLRGEVAMEWTELRHPEDPEITMCVPSNPDDLLSSEESRLLGFARSLLRHHRPDLDQDSAQGIKLLIGTCERITKVAEAARALANFLEFGAVNKETRPEIKDAQIDLYAAELYQVAGMTQRQVATKLGLGNPTGRDEDKGGHARAAAKIKRGTGLLKQAVGENRWPDYIRVLRAEYNSSG